MPASASCTEISVGKRQQAPPRDVLVIVGNLIKQASLIKPQQRRKSVECV